MIGSWGDWFPKLASPVREDPRFRDYIRFYAFLGEVKTEQYLKTTPIQEMFTSHAVYSEGLALTRFIGIANKLWEYFANVQGDGDIEEGIQTMASFTIPWGVATDSKDLRRFIALVYYPKIDVENQKAIAVGYANWIKKHPFEMTTVMSQLPRELLVSIRKLQTDPAALAAETAHGVKVLAKDAVEVVSDLVAASAKALGGWGIGALKPYVPWIIGGAAVVFFFPMIAGQLGRGAAAGTRGFASGLSRSRA